MATAEPATPLTAEQWAHLETLDQPAALAYVTAQGALHPVTVTALATMALAQAEHAPPLAAHWLALAEALEAQLGNAPARLAQIAYAQARLQLVRGELTVAEAMLRQAQLAWQRAGDADGYNRSLLGLTQILAMQGRYPEAEEAARHAIATATSEPAADQPLLPLMRRVAAHHNLATLLLYQERHAAALTEYEAIRQLLVTAQSTAQRAEEAAELTSKLAHSDLNRATALTFLDQPGAAESALQQAIAQFAQLSDALNVGRSRTNLGRLYLRTGQYAAALASFEQAFHELLGPTTTIATLAIDELRLADELLLEYATACLIINLLPEATQLLAHCETLFRSANQPYELGQTRYTQGLIALRTQQWQAAESTLDEAATLFAALQNSFWLNRTRLAQATAAYTQQQLTQARTLLDLLLVETTPTPAASLAWDRSGQIEAHLLYTRIELAQGALADARQRATLIAALLKGPVADEDHTHLWPHLAQQLQHLLGKIAQATGDHTTARHHLQAALTQLEAQRATLVVEEMRSAFVDDKSELYADLVETIFAMAPQEPASADPATVAEAFGVIEQARSRVLLERLLTALEEPAASAVDATDALRIRQLRDQLHWLYNQLMGESGSRRVDAQLSQQLQQIEAALQQVAWRQSPLLAQAQAVDLPTFQQSLAPDQQAIVYAALHQELLAFVVDRTSVRVYRQLTTLATIQAATTELRFQLGRVELGPAYLARHQARLTERLQAALHQLYQLVLAPMADALYAKRILFVPFGPLHRLPLHALWDGTHYWIERAECSYAPSASLAVLRRQPTLAGALTRWAGFAVRDPSIPAASEEVLRSAAYFAQAATYLDEQANRTNLWQAAAHHDILHLATHALFRPDNPFFSALKLGDGWVDVRELYQLPLAARLVVLSACESGVGELAGGDELVGLARGFLGAGTCELIASLWNVHDASAVQLMERFYHHLRDLRQQDLPSLRPAAALCAAQRQAIQEHQHPYYWAAFFVIGA
ncbi:MAG: CHAT domain-containing protein [Caldilineaceae bacterium]|nr:CHAT domain-containing protein [Caldilineaceae bacterium]